MNAHNHVAIIVFAQIIFVNFAESWESCQRMCLTDDISTNFAAVISITDVGIIPINIL